MSEVITTWVAPIQSTLETRRWVALGYPLMIEEGQLLRNEGVRVFDATMMFADIKEPVYTDTCCHLNELGETILADAVIDAIVAEIPTRR